MSYFLWRKIVLWEQPCLELEEKPRLLPPATAWFKCVKVCDYLQVLNTLDLLLHSAQVWEINLRLVSKRDWCLFCVRGLVSRRPHKFVCWKTINIILSMEVISIWINCFFSFLKYANWNSQSNMLIKKAVHSLGEILERPSQGDLLLLNTKAKVYLKKKMMHVRVGISSWSDIFLIIKSRVLCFSEPLWLQQVTTKWNKAVKSTVQRKTLKASPWSLQKKNDFVVKAGCECRRRLIHYLKVTLDPGWSTTTLFIRLLGGVKNVTAYSCYSPAAWLPWRPQEPSWGGIWWLIWTTTFVNILKLGIFHKPSETSEMPSFCQLLYNKLQVLSLCCTEWNSLSLTLKPFHQSPKPGVGSHGVRAG